MEVTQKEIDFTVEVFSKLLTQKMDRLAHGTILRQQMHDQIKRGERPVGPRPDYIRKAAMAIIQLLGSEAEDFNHKNPDDMISVQDFMDCLETAMGALRKQKGNG